MKFILSVLIVNTVFLSLVALASVDIKSGTFSLVRADQSLDTEFSGFDLHRTYNSTVSHNGLFGYGWCSTLETSLTVIASGQIAIRHCGAGEIKIFTSKEFKEANVKEALARLEKAMQQKQTNMTDDLRGRLTRSPALRAQMISQYGVKIETKEPVFVSVQSPDEKITFKNQNFTLTRRDGVIQKFDAKGRLLSHRYTLGDTLRFEYGPQGLKSLSSQRGQNVSFVLNEKGQVTQLKGPQGVTWFTYDTDDYLIKVKQAKNIENYSYEKGLMISYDSGAAKTTIAYNPVTYLVSRVDEAGCTDEYVYDIQKKAMKFSVERKFQCQNEPAAKVKYDFQYKAGSDGVAFQQKMNATDSKGGKTSAEYLSEGRPLVVRRQGEEFRYEYDQDNRISSRETLKDRLVFSYNAKGLLESIQKSVKGRQPASVPETTTYQYESNGRLKSVNLGDQSIQYSYDKKGMVNRMKSSKGLEFNISNDSFTGRIMKIEAKGYGHFNMKYSSDGQLLSSKWSGDLERGMGIIDSYDAFMFPLNEGSEIGALR